MDGFYDDSRKRAFMLTCVDLMEAAGVNVVEGFDAFRALMLACAWALANRAEAGGGLDKADLEADRKLAEELSEAMRGMP